MKRFLRPFFARLARALGITEIHRQIDELAQRVAKSELGAASLDQLASRKASDAVEIRANILWDAVVERDNAIQQAVIEASREHTETMFNELRRVVDGQISQLKRGLDHVRSTSETSGNDSQNSTESKVYSPSSEAIDESLYVSLEDYFRGETSVIRIRQSSYVPFIQHVVTAEKPLLDLGCGRGEWLSLLQELKIPAKGIDSNRACIEDCKKLGLDAELADLVAHLRSLPEKSLGAITMFQVMEHLPFPVLLNVLREILRVLMPGGVLIGEVPNSETLRVAATTFWIDPTHERPLFPGLLQFLAREVGFTEVNGVYSTPLADEPDVSTLPTEIQGPFLEMFRRINGPGDFALIAVA